MLPPQLTEVTSVGRGSSLKLGLDGRHGPTHDTWHDEAEAETRLQFIPLHLQFAGNGIHIQFWLKPTLDCYHIS